VLTFLAAGSPVAAPVEATAQEGEGLLVLVDAWAATPRNNHVGYAFRDVGSLAGGGEVTTISHASQLVPRIYVGWRLSDSPQTQLGMTFWEYDDSMSATTGEDPGNIGPLLAAPAFQAPPALLGLVDSATAESELRATLVDAGVRWNKALGERGMLRFDAELRFFRYRRDSSIVYHKVSNVTKELFINGSFESWGIGPRVAVSYGHRFGGRVGLMAQFGVALPLGELESTTRQEFLEDGQLESATAVSTPSIRQAFLQIEAELGMDVRLVGGLSLAGGYAFQFWSGVESTQLLSDVAARSAAVPDESDVVFEGWFAGLRYAF
jgi:hypothetical protein